MVKVPRRLQLVIKNNLYKKYCDRLFEQYSGDV